MGSMGPQASNGHWLAFGSLDSSGLAFQNMGGAGAWLGWIHASMSPGK